MATAAEDVHKEVEESGDEEESSGSDSGSSSEEEEMVEPKLKYERIGNDLTTILSKMVASCIAVHTKFVALGTHWGSIHILDHQGNNIRSKEVEAHTTTVNQISIDANGDYMASCSDDGRVVITGLYSNSNNQSVNFDRPVKAIALDPNFYKPNSGKQFVTGDTKLTLHEKGFLNRTKSSCLHEGEGVIRNIQWRSHFIAWANDLGVKVYDMSSRQRITFIARDMNPSLRPELFRCNLFWKDDVTLLIGWGDTVKVCFVKTRIQQDARNLPSRYVEIVAMFKTEFYVCGLSSWEDNVALLTYEESQDESGRVVATRPNLRVVEAHMDYYEELSNDALSIRGFNEYRCNEYHLECIYEENLFFIVSPKDVVVAKPRDEDDHISWLLEQEDFEAAMTAATVNQKKLRRHTFEDIGKQYMDYLLVEKDYEGAARLCVKVLGSDQAAWEKQAYKFASIYQLKVLAPFLPRGEPTLSPAIYEMVLNEFLQTDVSGFQKMVKELPSSLYNIPTIINAVLERIDHDRHNRVLYECLGELYTFEKRYDKALTIYLQLKHKDAFELIHKHNLFDTITDKIVMLMEFDNERAVTLLLENMEKIPIHSVVRQLENTPQLLHVYLDKLFHKDPHQGSEFHERQVKLYAEFNPTKLLSFLMSSQYIPLQKALEECQQRHLIPEMVFLLGKMGDSKQALKLITNELKDVNKAIDFCKEQNDQELWDDLIDYSIDKPDFIKGLLHNIGTDVDPIILIRKIREGMEIPGLRDSLVKILQDYNLQISLREGCSKILFADCVNLMERQVSTQRRGICIEEHHVCQGCRGKIIATNLRQASNVVMFYCRHAFHEDCLPAHDLEHCSICNAQRRGPGASAIFRK